MKPFFQKFHFHHRYSLLNPHKNPQDLLAPPEFSVNFFDDYIDLDDLALTITRDFMATRENCYAVLVSLEKNIIFSLQ